MIEDCPICLENVSEADFTTSCGHCFHAQCLTEWLMTSNTCPMCRTNLNEADYNNRIMVMNQEIEATNTEIQRRINLQLSFEPFVTRYNEIFDRLAAEEILAS